MYKLAVVGSRRFTDYALMKRVLDKRLDDIELIISGGARGADTLAQRYAKENGLPIHIYYPNYKRFEGRIAPLKRNITIAELADRMIAFAYDDSRGTRHVVSEMERFGKLVGVVELGNAPVA